MSKELKFNDNLSDKLTRGVKTLAAAVKTTLGPKGRNVLIEHGENPIITKDGVTVANNVNVADKFENLGIQIVKKAANKTAVTAGDGTTTATVLAEAIYLEGVKKVASGMNPILLKRGMDYTSNEIVKQITTKSKQITTDEELEHIATISANNDNDLGKLISEAIIKTGKDGNITVEDSPTFDSYFTLVEGIQYNRGYISQYFINEPNKLRCVLDNPYILVHEKKITNLEEIFNLLQMVKQQNRPLLIIAEDVEGEALTTLVINNARKLINVCVVKSPGYGLKQKENLNDIAVHTGATCICMENNITLATCGLQNLGTAKQVIVTRDSFTIVEGNGNKTEKAQQHIAQIRKAIEVAPTDLERNNLKERLAKLTGGVGIIRIGGVTETEIREKKDRVDDALCATKAAIEDGIVIGGGALLSQLQQENLFIIPDDENVDFYEGVHLVTNALSAPLKQICENAGLNGDVIINKIFDSKINNAGYNVNTDKVCDMFEEGIIDPAKVTKTAIKSAVSVAGLLLTAACGIVDVEI